MSDEKSLEELCAEHFNESFRANLTGVRLDICERLLKSGHLEMEGSIYRIPKPKPTAEDYLKGHKASGLKVGDRVKVLRKPEPNENGWTYDFNDIAVEFRELSVGKVFKIEADHHTEGFNLDELDWPYSCLEKVEPKYRPWTASEAIGKAIYSATEPKTGPITLRLIVAAGRATAQIQGEGFETYETLLQYYRNSDGTPCGVEIREEAE